MDSAQCPNCRTWYRRIDLAGRIDGVPVCRPCESDPDSAAAQRSRRMTERSDALEAERAAAAAAWTPPDGFDLGSIEARDEEGRPILIDGDRMAPPVEPASAEDPDPDHRTG